MRLYYGARSLQSMAYQVGKFSPMCCMQIMYLSEKLLSHITKIYNFPFDRIDSRTGSQLELT